MAAIQSIFSAVIVLSLGIFVIAKNIKAEANRAFLLFALSAALWLFFFGAAYLSRAKEHAVYFLQAGYIGVVFIVITAYHFIAAFLRKNSERKYVIFSCVIGISFIFLLFFSDLLVGKHELFFWGYYPVAGPAHPFYMLFLLLLVTRFIYLLVRNYREKIREGSRIERNRAAYVLVAIAVFSFSAMDFLPNYNLEIYPCGFIFVLGYTSLVAYAIVRHQLMDIDVVVRKTIVFAGLFAGIYAVIACFLYSGADTIESVVNNRWAALIPLVCVIVLIARPLEHALRDVTDRFLFQKKYDYKRLLGTFTRELLAVLDLDRLSELALTKLTDIMKIKYAALFLFDRERNRLELAFSTEKNVCRFFDNATAVISHFKNYAGYILRNRNENSKNENHSVNSVLYDVRANIGIPLARGADVSGILFLGAKKSDEEFSKDDISILLAICKTLAIAIANAELIKKLTEANARAAQNEKMAVIGMLSAGINHEICNPLGIARGKCESFLANTREGFYRGEEPEELIRKAEGILESVIRETDRAAVITKRLSSFAKPATGEDVEDVDIGNEIETVLEFIRYDLDIERIEITKNIEEGLPKVKADPKQIQEIFFNLLRNAVQAIPERGKIDIRVFRQTGGISIEIRDTGHGISERNLSRVFSPFFTTKGAEKGTGLGLFIVKRIVEKNNGSIRVMSRKNEGTTFDLFFGVQ
ncbi:MAG: ATP-binding protein [Candidatus Omnitrophota bacterium]